MIIRVCMARHVSQLPSLGWSTKPKRISCG
jgi:hypothetical protein